MKLLRSIDTMQRACAWLSHANEHRSAANSLCAKPPAPCDPLTSPRMQFKDDTYVHTCIHVCISSSTHTHPSVHLSYPSIKNSISLPVRIQPYVCTFVSVHTRFRLCLEYIHVALAWACTQACTCTHHASRALRIALLFVAVCVCVCVSVHIVQEMSIVQPLPGKGIELQGESAQISCPHK